MKTSSYGCSNGAQQVAMALVSLIVLFLQTTPSSGQNQTPITTVRGVTQMSREKSDQRHPVQIQGVVTFFGGDSAILFVEDRTGGMFVNVGTLVPNCRAGDEVTIRGYTESGRYTPVVALVSLETSGPGVLPKPQPVSISELWTGTYDCQLIETRGHVRSYSSEGTLTKLEIVDGEYSALAWVQDFPKSALAELDFAEVQLTGPNSVGSNEGRTITKIEVWLRSGQDVKFLRTGRQVGESTPLVTLESFNDPGFAQTNGGLARVRGTVTQSSKRHGIVLQGNTASLRVPSFNAPLPAVGSAVEVIGWPRRSGNSALIVGANVKMVGRGASISPESITLAQARLQPRENRLVSLGGVMRHRVARDGENHWIIEQDGDYFEAILPEGAAMDTKPMVVAGTTLRLTGVLQNIGPSADSFSPPRLLLRSPSDVESISSPPWPTDRVLRILSITLAMHVIGLVAMLVIYRRLRRRTADLTETRGALEIANRELENRVQARTATLTAANAALRESEERFRQLATHIDEIFWMVSPDNKELLYLSPSFERICGRSVDDIYKAPDQWLQLIHPEDRDGVFRVAFQQPVVSEYELDYRIVRPDGSIRWLNDRAFPIRDANGVTFRVAGIAADVTERKRSEEELREQNIALSNAMPGISRLTPDGYYTTANINYARLNGCEPIDLIGTHFSETIHPEDMLAATKSFELMLAEGKAEGEIRGVRRDGSVYWKQVLLVRINQPCGKMTGFHCFIRDINSRKRDELLLEGQKAVLETIADGAPLRETLDALARFIESQSERSRSSILVATEDGNHLRNGAAPNLPAPIQELTECLAITPDAGSWGASAHQRQRVVVADIEHSPLFNREKDRCLDHGLRAVASAPVLGSGGDVLGIISLFFDTPRKPTGDEEHLLHLATQMAAIAIERDLTQNAERLAQERYRGIVDNATDAVITFDEQQRIEVFNQAAETMFGCSMQEAVGKNLTDFIPPSHYTALQQHLRTLDSTAHRHGVSVPLAGRRSDGEEFPIEASISQSAIHGRTLTTAILRDLTDKQRAERTRVALESRLRQAHKMEAIGTLAGGIAHDFNNILGAVMLNIELARGELPSKHPAQEYLAALRGSSLRARDLVRQILAFSRQQEQQRNILRLERLVDEALKLIRAALPSNIEINLRLTSDGPSILADATQIHQVLTNLSANAAHAMRGSGGRLDIQQCTIEVDDGFTNRSPDLQPGRYVELAITDTGTGMPPEILERIFDPFFTTKGPGEGTGLGLAVVHGIMKDHDGAILVESTPGKGTTFRLYFPAVEQPETRLPEDRQPLARGQGERILIIDDEEPLLRVNQRTLERLGYKVTACSTPSAALNLFRSNPDNFDAVITDLAMPGMNGLELSREFLRLRPTCPIILTTGYTTTLDPENIKDLGLAGLLFKPATTAALGEAVHDALYAGKSA